MKNINKLLDQIKELHSKGYSDSEIARILKMSTSNINRHRNILKLKTHRIKRTYNNEYDKIRGYMIRNVKFSAKRRNIEFNLDFTDFELPKYCPILNVELDYKLEGNSNDFNHASLDRIDNSKGYIKGNVLVMSRLANIMKNEATFDQLILFADNIQTLMINYYKNQGALGNITDIFPNLELRKFNLDS